MTLCSDVFIFTGVCVYVCVFGLLVICLFDISMCQSEERSNIFSPI